MNQDIATDSATPKRHIWLLVGLIANTLVSLLLIFPMSFLHFVNSWGPINFEGRPPLQIVILFIMQYLPQGLLVTATSSFVVSWVSYAIEKYMVACIALLINTAYIVLIILTVTAFFLVV